MHEIYIPRYGQTNLRRGGGGEGEGKGVGAAPRDRSSRLPSFSVVVQGVRNIKVR